VFPEQLSTTTARRDWRIIAQGAYRDESTAAAPRKFAHHAALGAERETV